MGYEITNLYTLHNIICFQFPLWDTKLNPKFYNKLKNFQFPLWDTYFLHTHAHAQTPVFQFPLWDTKKIKKKESN